MTRRTTRRVGLTGATLALALLSAPAAAQDDPSTQGAMAAEPYADATARALVQRARGARDDVGRAITGYTALVRHRAAAMLRLPLKDRTLGRSESAARVHWRRDGATLVELLAGREQEAQSVSPMTDFDGGHLFDPTSDRVYFGLGVGRDDVEEDLWIAHPLADESERHYRYASGDTLTLRLPGGGAVRAVELRVTPRQPSWHYLAAVLWIEPESGAVVQAVYNPSRNLDVERDTAFIDEEDRDALRYIPGVFKPLQGGVELIAVEYSLWDLEHWLPRRMRIDGHARAGVLRARFSAEVSYRMEQVWTDTDEAAPSPDSLLAALGVDSGSVRRHDRGDGRIALVVVPDDEDVLLRSGELPPPIWEDAPGFATDDELEALVEQLERAVPRPLARAPLETRFEWGPGGRGLLRYNRVEGLSVGARAAVGRAPYELTATGRLGTAELHPDIELAASHAGDRTLGLRVYHGLRSVDRAGSALGLGNSFGALVFGRDDGEYYRATGATLELGPGPLERDWARGRLFAERQRAVDLETDWSLAHLLGGDDFRPNLAADAADLLGASVRLSPWWGVDPRAVQGGVELFAEAAIGDFDFARADIIGRTAVPLSGRFRLGVEAGAGTSWSTLPAQYHWFLGGPRTLRGYGGSAAVGPDYSRLRLELARRGDGATWALFSDAGWAGTASEFDADETLVSVGAGMSILDGLIRIDLARALRAPIGWRLDVHLDALL